MEPTIKKYPLILYAAYPVLFLAVYFQAFKWLIMKDWPREDYSHCFLIPLVIIYILWTERQRITSVPSSPSWLGLAAFVPGLALYWLGELGGEFYSVYMSFWLVLIGVLWMHFGFQRIKALSFPLLLVLTMFPLPYFLNTKALFQLKLISTRLGVKLLHLYGMSAYSEGNIIDLGSTQLQVVDACSGLRYVLPLLVLSLILSHFVKAHFWKRVALVISSIPMAIIVNSLRISLTGILHGIYGARVAEEFFHGFSGWLIFVITMPFLLLEMWFLKKLPPQEPPDTGLPAEPGIPEARPESRKFAPQYVAVIILALTAALSYGIDFREKVPMKKSFRQFPLSIGEWSGVSKAMPQEFLKELDLSDYVLADYRNRQNREVNFYIAYYQSQSKGESIHSPDTCLPAGGWLFREADLASIELRSGASLPVKRAYIEKSGARELSFYWFPMRGRNLVTPYQMKFYNFWDALTRHRTDGALVRVITPVYRDEKIEDTEARLQAFTREIAPILDEFIPGKQGSS